MRLLPDSTFVDVQFLFMLLLASASVLCFATVFLERAASAEEEILTG